MGIMEEHMLITTSTISLHQLRDLWQSPRGTVLRIQALAMVAIIFSFFLAAYGSCRRWSNSWIVQKGFFAAHVLSLSLGTYSIGLMQSSSVKSEMYPIWTVSLFTLFGCIDPVTTYNGLDYKGPLSKVVFGICLHCGYVLLMSISTISTVVGNTAIGLLSAITFIKGFHRSLALVQQSKMRNKLQNLLDHPFYGHGSVLRNNPPRTDTERDSMIINFATGIDGNTDHVSLSQFEHALFFFDPKGWLQSCYDVCVAMSLCHHLQRHFLGLGYREPNPQIQKGTDYKWALKVIEIELALAYDYFFTGNPFLHYYQAKTASLWALASFIGICFVGVAAAIPGTMSSHCRSTSVSSAGAGGCATNVVNTTTADLVVTFVILVFLALLQLMHLVRSWTSNWARVAVASAYAQHMIETSRWWPWPRWLRLKVFVATSSNWFDKYLWQDKIGQYSVLPEGRLTAGKNNERSSSSRKECKSLVRTLVSMVGFLYKKCDRLVKMLGLDYIGEVLWDLLVRDTNKIPAVRLDNDVKASIVDFLCQIETDRLDGNWLSFSKKHPSIRSFLPSPEVESHGYKYTECVMKLHIATWYCELAEQEPKQEDGLSKAEERRGRREENRNRRVANALSKYCAYLVESAPELLPGPAPETKRAYHDFKKATRIVLGEDKDSTWFFGRRRKKNKDRFLGPLSDPETWTETKWIEENHVDPGFLDALDLAKELLGVSDDGSLHDVTRSSDPWETLALVWVRMLVYAAPYGNVETHMRRLSQGGEFITHLWTLLYHLDIREWKPSADLPNITTIDEAETVLAKDDMAVVAFLDSSPWTWTVRNELATASKLEGGVRFYQTSSPDVAKLFHIGPAAGGGVLILLNKIAEQKFTLYDGVFSAYNIAYFVTTAKKLALDKAQTQSLEDGGQTEDESSADEHE